ncbi:N-6 DNA methylase [Lysinibacillus sp. MHQ-1]|nr:N-6 DNA methylase [Lysinibacillus sp. MHQ-1]
MNTLSVSLQWNRGKKAGEFYTPHQVSEVMAQIVAKNNRS